jgi:hypothetical protein
MYQPSGTTQKIRLLADAFDANTITLVTADKETPAVPLDEETAATLFHLSARELATLYRRGLSLWASRDAVLMAVGGAH